MPVRILDLQHLYGVAGAREQFEKLLLALVESLYDSARTIEVKQGDGGIDIYVGPFTAPIDIYQAKYFPQELGNSQKDQIRKSFSRCSDNTAYILKSWTLCLPRNMTIDETKWFDGWRAKQSSVIPTPWTAGKLETLLMKDENKGIKEHFFKQEHLTQIREIHDKLTAEPEPITFTPKIERLQPLRIVEFEGRPLLCLRLHYTANNHGSVAIKNWAIRYGFTGRRVKDYVVTERDFPDVGNGPGYYHQNRTILPTMNLTGYFSFGVRLLSPMPAVRQLAGVFEDLLVFITPVTETHVGNPVEFRLLNHIDPIGLQDAVWQL